MPSPAAHGSPKIRPDLAGRPESGRTLKGGLVLELRLERARTSKDIELRLTGSTDGLLEKLQEAGLLDLGDHITFEVAVDEEHPEIEAEGMNYGRASLSRQVRARREDLRHG